MLPLLGDGPGCFYGFPARSLLAVRTLADGQANVACEGKNRRTGKKFGKTKIGRPGRTRTSDLFRVKEAL